MTSVLKTYYRLTKPGIIYGNLLTVTAGFLFAAKGEIDGGLLLATLSGTSLVVAAGCVFNNYLDRGIDTRMTRTKQRALATGEISVGSALTFATVLALTGSSLLVIYTNFLTCLIGAIAFVVYVAVYGWAKRRSVHGTLVGTVAGAAPPVAGYTAVTGQFDTAALLLFIIMACWQMAHFYAIAIYRLDDYRRAGIPVLPAKQGIRIAKIQIMLYIMAFIVANFELVGLGYAGTGYLVIMALFGAVWLSKAYQGFKLVDDQRWARSIFLFSLVVIVAFSVTLSIDASFT